MNALMISAPETYGMAVQALCAADRTGDPEDYQLAARYFSSIGYSVSAARCMEKAEGLRTAGHSPAEEEEREDQG